ncbi:MAG: response regulator transcription factor [Anaerolineae bacterium]|jgi:DNA-binding response OmpR family regulator
MIKCKVLIADSDREPLASVRCHLEKDGYQLFPARNGPEALSLIRRGRADVLVVDQSWLEEGGLDLGSVLRAETPIIILSGEVVDEEMSLDTASEMADHAVKPVDPCEVLSAVRAVLRRVGKTVYEGPEEMRCADIVIDRRCHEVHVRGEEVHLAPTELKLLEVLVAEPGRAFTRLELLGRVFGYDYEGLERTVDTHVKNLRKKIEPNPGDPAYVETVYGVGYRFTTARDAGQLPVRKSSSGNTVVDSTQTGDERWRDPESGSLSS